jgi:hypothetical protein
MKEYFNWKSIVTGVVSSLVASGIFYVLTKRMIWTLQLPLWLWLLLSCVVVFLFVFIAIITKWKRIHNAIDEYKEGCFGNSYDYTWKFRKSDGPYSAYGYEAYEIKKKQPLNELNNEHTITFGHEVNEYNAKRIIQLTIVAMVDKKAAKLLKPTIEHLHSLEQN